MKPPRPAISLWSKPAVSKMEAAPTPRLERQRTEEVTRVQGCQQMSEPCSPVSRAEVTQEKETHSGSVLPAAFRSPGRCWTAACRIPQFWAEWGTWWKPVGPGLLEAQSQLLPQLPSCWDLTAEIITTALAPGPVNNGPDFQVAMLGKVDFGKKPWKKLENCWNVRASYWPSRSCFLERPACCQYLGIYGLRRHPHPPCPWPIPAEHSVDPPPGETSLKPCQLSSAAPVVPTLPSYLDALPPPPLKCSFRVLFPSHQTGEHPGDRKLSSLSLHPHAWVLLPLALH